MITNAFADAPYLDVTDPAFSIRSQAVKDARSRSWFARTPFGIAVLRYDAVQKMLRHPKLRHPKLRQGSHLWPQHNGVTTGKCAIWWCNRLLCVEGDTHARLRRMANPAFNPKLIADLQPKFQALANRLMAFLYVPIQVLIAFSFSTSRSLTWPIPGLTLGWYRKLFANADLLTAVANSFYVAIFASLLALAVGVTAALALHQFDFPGKTLFRRCASVFWKQTARHRRCPRPGSAAPLSPGARHRPIPARSMRC